MAYAFLKGLGVDGNIGALTVDLRSNEIKASRGHEIVSKGQGGFEIKSSRYPFCVCEPPGQTASAYPDCATDDPAKDTSIRAALALVPFHRDLNRLMLVAQNGAPGDYKVSWGAETKTFTSAQLAAGINLAEEFVVNPFNAAFARVDAAVTAKQVYETKQIKQLFHGAEGKADMEGVAARTEQERGQLAQAIKSAFVPVTHTLRIEPR
jgi:hypothetical protein